MEVGSFYYSGTTTATYKVTEGFLTWLLKAIGEITDFLIGLMTMGDRLSYEANRGKQHAAEMTREYVNIGQQMSNIHEGANIPSIIAQKRLSETNPQLVTAFFPSVGPNISWEPNDLNLDYKPTELDINWQELDRSMTYIAGSVKFNVVQRASVDIEYVGGPNYFPKSSDPSAE